MEVTGRTKTDEPLQRAIDARKLLANFVAREGRWFAENDFCSRKNPFKLVRLSVGGSPRVDYRSVLYLPITHSVRGDLPPGQFGPTPFQDFCIGVICVHSSKPYRFWRWGDHKNDNDAGSGNVAVQRATPYIALVSKLIEHSAHQVPLEAQQP